MPKTSVLRPVNSLWYIMSRELKTPFFTFNHKKEYLYMGILTLTKRQQRKKDRIIQEYITEQSLKLNVADGLNNSLNTRQYVETISHIDRMQNNGFVTIKGLPFHSYAITNELYDSGSVGFIRDMAGGIQFVQVVPVSWTPMGLTQEFRVITKFSTPLIDTSKVFINHVDGCILYDTLSRNNHPSRAWLCATVLDDMATVFEKIITQTHLHGARIIQSGVAVDIQNQFAEVTKEWYSNTNIHIMYDLLNKPEVLQIDGKLGQLWALLKQYDVFRESLHGFGKGNFGNDKSERMLSNEVQDGSDGCNLIYQMRKMFWTEWQAEMLDVFNIPIELIFNKENNQNENNENSSGEWGRDKAAD